jgi:hypothetical protein
MVVVYTAGPDCRLYRVLHAFLAAVSVKLAESCKESTEHNLDVSDAAFRIFLAWLLHHDIGEVANSQLTLGQTWNFGSQWKIPAFQEAVMRRVI